MKSQTALVRTDSRGELYTVTCVYVCVALVVEPRHAEDDLTLWIYESLENSVTAESLFVSINDRTDGLKYLVYCLVEFRLCWVLLFYLLDYFIYIRHGSFPPVYMRSHSNHTTK